MKRITQKKLEKFQQTREDLEAIVKDAWSKWAGFGCGYFIDFEIRGNVVRVEKEKPQRHGGGIAYDEMPLSLILTPVPQMLHWRIIGAERHGNTVVGQITAMSAHSALAEVTEAEPEYGVQQVTHGQFLADEHVLERGNTPDNTITTPIIRKK